MDATSIPCGQSVITARRSSGRIFIEEPAKRLRW
jgi:hypothetical protein